LTHDGWAAVSAQALHLVHDGQVRRWIWSQIDSGRLDPETNRLTIGLVSGEEQTLELIRSRHARPFATAFRERVQSSVVHVVEVPVPSSGIVRVAVRRDDRGSLFTQVIGPSSIDLADPAVAELIRAGEVRAREAVGLAE
jgi:hypothetical protein